MAVVKNGIFAYDNGKPVTPQSLGISLSGIQTCQQFFNSGSINDNTQKYALYKLVADLQNYNIWDKMKAIYPFVGNPDVSSSFELNLKDPNTFRGTFTSGWTFNNEGITPGASTYFDTTFNPYINFNSSSFSFGGYTPTNINDSGYHGASPPNYLMHSFQSFTRAEAFIPGPTIQQFISYNIGTSGNSGIVGFAMINFSSLTFTLYNNGVIGLSKAGTVPPSLPNLNMFIGAYNSSGTPAPGGYDNKTISFYYYSDGLTDTEAANFYTAVQRFQTTLGRQV